MERVEKERIDYLFIILIILLLGIGLSMLFSASHYHSEVKLGKGPLHFFNKQLLFIVIGTVALVFAARFPVEKFQKLIPVLVIASIFLSLLTFLPGIGREFNGGRRWIAILDYTFQPSELMKVVLVLYIATILKKKESRLDDPFNALLPPFIVILIFSGIVFFQNDLSTAVFLLFMALSMFFIAKIKLIYFAFIGLLMVPLSLLLIITDTYRLEKILTFFDPLRDPYRFGFQIRHAKYAFEQGGFFGKGIGMSTQKLGYLPEPDSDFIFAITAEEIGFIGTLFIIALFVVFAVRGYSIALNSKDKYTYYLGFGITTTIFVQALINMFVTVGLLPTTGMVLPFFSIGGSAMIINLFMCGLLINISRKSDNRGGYFYG
ncbi:MAG: putative lipid II flippase FtsW [Spirochaetales bacterium]|nr:putative lipid II flippase FtsW [Spirochaetales bacterium]